MEPIGLLGAAAFMGLAGAPHCAAMCGATCTALITRCGGTRAAQGAFHLGRVAGYALAGAAAASSTLFLREALAWAPWIKPLWTLAHVAALAVGAYMLLRGELPSTWGWRAGPRLASASSNGWQPMRGPVRAAAVGSAWMAWPCGLSQSALLLALLADRPEGGAAVMATFALASSPGLVVLPLLWQRLVARHGVSDSARAAVAIRLSGGLLAAASAWALGHGLWRTVANWCGISGA